MAKFYVDARSPIVAELIRQDFDFEESEALRLIDMDEAASNTDGTFALGTGAACIAATAGTLALSGLTLPILVPAIGIGLSSVSYWNSKVAARSREMETQFLSDHPEVLVKVCSKLRAGEARETIAAAFEQCLRAYRWGDVKQMERVLETTQAQSGIQPTNALDATQPTGQPLPQTELQPSDNVAAASPSMQVINGVETIAPRDIATDLGNNPQSALIFGTPGAGKGMTISNAIRTLRAKLPNVTVMMVDPKGDKKERGYWESQVDIFESRSLLKSSPRSSAEWMMRCVEKFQDIDGPKLLVWDELFASITVLKGQNVPKGEDAFPCLTDFQQFISLNLSLGPSSGTWVWGMSQSANLSDLGLTSGGLSTTRIIALISPDNVGAVEGYLATKAITAPKGGMETLDRMMEQSPVGRACYDGKTKRWYPTARLENHSGFDRDSADWNNLEKVAPPKPVRNLEEVFSPEFFQGHPLLQDDDAIEVETRAIDIGADEVEPWESDEAIEVGTVKVESVKSVSREELDHLKTMVKEAEKQTEQILLQKHLEEKFFRIVKMLEEANSVSVKDIQKKLKLGTSLEAQQLAQMFCLQNKGRVQFKSKNNSNSTVSYFVERVA